MQGRLADVSCNRFCKAAVLMRVSPSVGLSDCPLHMKSPAQNGHQCLSRHQLGPVDGCVPAAPPPKPPALLRTWIFSNTIRMPWAGSMAPATNAPPPTRSTSVRVSVMTSAGVCKHADGCGMEGVTVYWAPEMAFRTATEMSTPGLCASSLCREAPEPPPNKRTLPLLVS